MNASELVEAVGDEQNTELSRLGSSKSLYADTQGEMEPAVVLGAAADATHHAAETLEDWASDSDGDLAEAYVTVGEGQRDQHARLVDELDEYDIGEPPAVVEALADHEDDIERLGAVVGWSLVAEHKINQGTGFFTGQADPMTASVFRELGGEYERYRETVGVELEDQCDGEDDWDQAREAAVETVQAAYDEYVERLEAQGVNPKPVC